MANQRCIADLHDWSMLVAFLHDAIRYCFLTAAARMTRRRIFFVFVLFLLFPPSSNQCVIFCYLLLSTAHAFTPILSPTLFTYRFIATCEWLLTTTTNDDIMNTWWEKMGEKLLFFTSDEILTFKEKRKNAEGSFADFSSVGTCPHQLDSLDERHEQTQNGTKRPPKIQE